MKTVTTVITIDDGKISIRALERGHGEIASATFVADTKGTARVEIPNCPALDTSPTKKAAATPDPEADWRPVSPPVEGFTDMTAKQEVGPRTRTRGQK